ncbi:MAG: DNA modification methylase [Pseudomonadota bacterium]
MSDTLWENRIVAEGLESPEQLLANPMNHRQHPKAQRDAMRGALNEIGWIQRIIVNQRTGHLVDGHLRVELALEDGVDQMPVLYVDLSPEEERKALASVDAITALAQVDQDAVNALVESVHAQDEDFDALLQSLVNFDPNPEEAGATDDDHVPAATPRHRSKKGDIWILGNHRLMCGDGCSSADLTALCQGQQCDMVWTDPPYNVDYHGSDGKTIENDKMSDQAFRNFLQQLLAGAYAHTKEGGAIYVAHADIEAYNFIGALTESGWRYTQQLIWVKNAMVMGRKDYQFQHEPVLYGWKPGAAHRWYGEYNKKTVIDEDVDVQAMDTSELRNYVRELRNAANSTVVREDKPSRNSDHPTMKPVRLVLYFLKNSSLAGNTVLDVCGGAGSTLIAAHKLGRHARLMEIDPVYCDVIVKRWQEFTNQEAIHEDTGETFNGTPLVEA